MAAFYEDRELLVHLIRRFLAERPEWQESCLDDGGNLGVTPVAFFHLLVWAQYRALLTPAEAEVWGDEMQERLGWLAAAHQRIDVVDHP